MYPEPDIHVDWKYIFNFLVCLAAWGIFLWALSYLA